MVKIADGSLNRVAGYGDIQVSEGIVLKNVFHVPLCVVTLFQLLNSLVIVGVLLISCQFQDALSGRMIGCARLHGGHFLGHSSFFSRQSLVSSVKSSPVSNLQEIMLLHFRLGHPSFVYLVNLFPSLFKNNEDFSLFQREFCAFAKHTRIFFSQNLTYHLFIFLSFIVICGDHKKFPLALTSKKWFLMFIDDHTRVTWVYLLQHKSEATSAFKNFRKMVETQFYTNIRALRTDNGTKYFNTILSSYLQHHGIIQFLCQYTTTKWSIKKKKSPSQPSIKFLYTHFHVNFSLPSHSCLR